MGGQPRASVGGVGLPYVKYAIAKAVKKGEDYIVALPKSVCPTITDEYNEARSFGFFGVLDGHNGTEAAVHAAGVLQEFLVEGIEHSSQHGTGGGVNMTHAVKYAFLKTDRDIISRWRKSGTTATVAVLDKWDLTVGNVGDSRAVMDDGRNVAELTYDFRLEDSETERNRVIAAGGVVARLDDGLGNGVGPLRVWPGGLCLSRALGDADVGRAVISDPHVTTVPINPMRGARLIIASDGLWDACTTMACVQATRSLAVEQAAQELVKLALNKRGLRDDTSVLVVDVLPDRSAQRPPGMSSSQGMSRWLCGMGGGLTEHRSPREPVLSPWGSDIPSREDTLEMIDSVDVHLLDQLRDKLRPAGSRMSPLRPGSGQASPTPSNGSHMSGSQQAQQQLRLHSQEQKVKRPDASNSSNRLSEIDRQDSYSSYFSRDAPIKPEAEPDMQEVEIALTRRGAGIETSGRDVLPAHTFGNGVTAGAAILGLPSEIRGQGAGEALPMWGYRKEKFVVGTFVSGTADSDGQSGSATGSQPATTPRARPPPSTSSAVAPSPTKDSEKGKESFESRRDGSFDKGALTVVPTEIAVKGSMNSGEPPAATPGPAVEEVALPVPVVEAVVTVEGGGPAASPGASREEDPSLTGLSAGGEAPAAAAGGGGGGEGAGGVGVPPGPPALPVPPANGEVAE